MIFKLNEKIYELTDGYFTFVMKYSVTVLIAWMIGILIVCTYPCFAWGTEKYPPFLVFLKDYAIVEIITGIFLLYYFTKKQFEKYKKGLIIEFHFEDENKELSLQKINTLHGKITNVTIPYDQLKVVKEVKSGKIFGIQTIYHIYNGNEFISDLNVAFSAWKREEKFVELVERLERFI